MGNTTSIILAGAIAAALGQPSITAFAQGGTGLEAIPPQSLDAALRTFAKRAGLQLIYVSDATRGRATLGSVTGATPGDALAQLLAGTGLNFEFINERTVAIRLPRSTATVDAKPVSLLSSAAMAATLPIGPGEQNVSAVKNPLAATAPTSEIAEITVTAQRRTESVQDVPITLQVLTAETLSQLNVVTFDDFVKYLPNVTSGGFGPGQSDIYMRGLSFTQGGNGDGSAPTIFPNVAVYLDEQSGQLPGRNLDVYAADLERIEVLEGPQGTLFGAGAQAGVIRYITNKPKLDVTEGNVNAGYATTAHGDNSSNVDATINIPLIPDTLALRAVIYNDRRGGYINNIPGTFARAATDLVAVNYFSGSVPPNSGSINNNGLVSNAINPVSYQGLRVSGLWKFNDDWNVLIAQSYQNMEADGVFWEEQYDGLGKSLPDLSVELYNPSYNKDKFEDTQLTLTGRIGQLEIHLRRRLPRPQRANTSGLHELLAWAVRGLLPVQLSGLPVHRRNADAKLFWLLLLAKRVLYRARKCHASESRSTTEHTGRLASASSRRPLLGELYDSRRFELVRGDKPGLPADRTAPGCHR